MVIANLLPEARRRTLARDDRAANWAVFLAAYSALLAISWFASQQMLRGGTVSLERRTAAIETERASLDATIQSYRAKMAATQTSLATARSIADHPDWSSLLGLTASLRGDDIEVERVSLGPRRIEGKTAKQTITKGVWLKISGVGKDHRAIAQFALRLENAGLFERVGLSDARKNVAGPDGLVGFEIEATIDEPGPGAKP